jgi:hypothetical protein
VQPKGEIIITTGEKISCINYAVLGKWPFYNTRTLYGYPVPHAFHTWLFMFNPFRVKGK